MQPVSWKRLAPPPGGVENTTGVPQPPKIRLDTALWQRGMAPSRSRAQAIIMAGQVQVNGTRALKSGMRVAEKDVIHIQSKDHGYVSRGGLKLEAALNAFSVPVGGAVCLDAGASTGGFTDCLLQSGAKRVYAVDVGYGQLAWKLRQDPRVVVIERTNIRCMAADALPEAVDLVTIDVSFISLKRVVPAVFKFMKPEACIVPLIKPQFEVGRGQVGKGGVVKDERLHRRVLDELRLFFTAHGLMVTAEISSPIRGPKGNKEFLLCLHRSRRIS